MCRLLLQLKISYLNSSSNLRIFKLPPLQGLHTLILLVLAPSVFGFKCNEVSNQKVLSPHFVGGTRDGNAFNHWINSSQFDHFFSKCFQGLSEHFNIAMKIGREFFLKIEDCPAFHFFFVPCVKFFTSFL